MTKACSRCKETKSLTDFYTKSGYCKPCHVDYYREKARAEPGYFNRFQKKSRRTKREWVTAIKVERGCADCPERHPACLEFHHLDPAAKTIEIAKLLDRNTTRARVAAEILKCVVLCSNCHRKRHWNEKQDNAAQSA